jgi:hypothetical protein
MGSSACAHHGATRRLELADGFADQTVSRPLRLEDAEDPGDLVAVRPELEMLVLEAAVDDPLESLSQRRIQGRDHQGGEHDRRVGALPVVAMNSRWARPIPR